MHLRRGDGLTVLSHGWMAGQTANTVKLTTTLRRYSQIINVLKPTSIGSGMRNRQNAQRDAMLKDAEHVFFACPRFAEVRKEMEDTLGEVPDPGTLVKLMIQSKENWAVNQFATSVMTKLRVEERRRREQRIPAVLTLM